MIACFDVHYTDERVCAAAVVFNDWTVQTPIEKFAIPCNTPNEYVAGEFFKRELGPLQTVIAKIKHPIQTFVIDAYCHLDSDGLPGLGAQLHRELPDDAVVVGIAKNRFRQTNHAVEIFRGDSLRGLFVTSIGIDYKTAAEHIKSMHGDHRIPTLLKTVDQLSRNADMSAN